MYKRILEHHKANSLVLEEIWMLLSATKVYS